MGRNNVGRFETASNSIGGMVACANGTVRRVSQPAPPRRGAVGLGSSSKTGEPESLYGNGAARRVRGAFEKMVAAGMLEKVQNLSYGKKGSGNYLIHGENADVLRQLRDSARDTVRCIYIDPPYNNQEQYNHYSDALPHEVWISGLSERVEMLWDLLRSDGSLWISIDDRELHYLKVAVDGVVGRSSFVTTIVWEHRTTRENRKAFSNNHEYVLVYAKDPALFRKSRRLLPANAELLSRYRNPDSDPRGPWQSVSINVQAGHGTASQFYEFAAPNGRRYRPPLGRCWSMTKERLQHEVALNNIWFGKSGVAVPRKKRFMDAGTFGLTPETIWKSEEVGSTDIAKKHLLSLLPDARVFDTPKPEALISRILHIATDPTDVVLDAYLGSGTTAAVAHKMGRSYIGIDSGSQVASHGAVRLAKVVDGEDGGVSKATGWSGGGGFDYLRQR